MLNVYLEVERLRHSIKQKFDTSIGASPVEETILFDVYPPNSQRFTLSNGERFAREEDVVHLPSRPNVISGTMIIKRDVHQGDASERVMEYLPTFESARRDHGSNSQIFFTCYLAPEVFDVLLGNIRSGLVPTTASVGFPLDLSEGAALKYGAAPDGHHKVWNVDLPENRWIPIEAIGFHYEQPVVTPPSDDKVEEAQRLERQKRTADLNDRASLFRSIESIRTNLSVLLLLAVALGIGLFFLR